MGGCLVNRKEVGLGWLDFFFIFYFSYCLKKGAWVMKPAQKWSGGWMLWGPWSRRRTPERLAIAQSWTAVLWSSRQTERSLRDAEGSCNSFRIRKAIWFYAWHFLHHALISHLEKNSEILADPTFTVLKSLWPDNLYEKKKRKIFFGREKRKEVCKCRTPSGWIVSLWLCPWSSCIKLLDSQGIPFSSLQAQRLSTRGSSASILTGVV